MLLLLTTATGPLAWDDYWQRFIIRCLTKERWGLQFVCFTEREGNATLKRLVHECWLVLLLSILKFQPSVYMKTRSEHPRHFLMLWWCHFYQNTLHKLRTKREYRSNVCFNCSVWLQKYNASTPLVMIISLFLLYSIPQWVLATLCNCPEKINCAVLIYNVIDFNKKVAAIHLPTLLRTKISTFLTTGRRRHQWPLSVQVSRH